MITWVVSSPKTLNFYQICCNETFFNFVFYETTKNCSRMTKTLFWRTYNQLWGQAQTVIQSVLTHESQASLGKAEKVSQLFYIFNVGNQLYEIARWQKCFGLAWSWQYCYGYSQSTFNAQSAWVELSKLNNILLAFCHFKVLARSFGLVIVYHVILVKDT